MEKKLIIEEITRINEIMGITNSKLLLEGGIGEFILKMFDRGEAGGVVKSIDDVVNAMRAKNFEESTIDMLKELAGKDILNGTEKEALSNIIRVAFPEIIEKSVENMEDFILTNYGNKMLTDLKALMSKPKIPDTKILEWMNRYMGVHGIDEEFFKVWRDEYRKIKPQLPESLEGVGEKFGEDLEVGDVSDFAKSIFTDLEGIELTSEEADLVNRAAKIVEEGLGKISGKEYVVLVSELEKIGLDLEKAIKEYDSKMKGLDKVKQTQWEGKKRKILISMSKFWDSLNILKQNVSKLKPKSMTKFLLNTFKYVIAPLTLLGVGVSICESKNFILSGLCSLFKKGAKKAVSPLTNSESNQTTTTPNQTDTTPTTNDEQLVKDFAKKEGYDIKSTTHNNDGSWTVTDNDGSTVTYKVTNGKVEYQGN